MKNSEVAQAFAFNNIDEAKALNLEYTNGKLYSYATVIAQRLNDGRVILNETKYSCTTSRHQYYLRHHLNKVYNENEIIKVNNVPRGTYNLEKYIKKV